MEITLYTTHCPQCKMVEMLLKREKIEYIENTNVDEMIQKGIKNVPVLMVDDSLYTGAEIFNWINSQKEV